MMTRIACLPAFGATGPGEAGGPIRPARRRYCTALIAAAPTACVAFWVADTAFAESAPNPWIVLAQPLIDMSAAAMRADFMILVIANPFLCV
jgi:hypothetical protein